MNGEERTIRHAVSKIGLARVCSTDLVKSPVRGHSGWSNWSLRPGEFKE